MTNATIAGAVLFAASLCASGAVARDCPDVAMTAATEISYTAKDLWTEVRHRVTAGGSVDLADCARVGASGKISRRPDFNLWLTSNTANRTIRFSVVAPAGCDPVILVNTASGVWLSGDKTGSSGPHLRVAAAPTGRYDIWVGTYSGAPCPEAELRIESF